MVLQANVNYVDLVYLVTALVPSETACLANSPGRRRRTAVWISPEASLGGHALQDVVDEGVHDGHGHGGHSGVGLHLLQHLLDVDGVRFLPLLLAFLIDLGHVLLAIAGLLGCLSGGLGWHRHVPKLET